MLLLHQAGSVKIGEVVRYTVTYTPADDRILPAPSALHLKIRNTCSTALRAAFVHGPYTLYVAAYPATFNPNKTFENPDRDGVPEFEPNLKAGGTFTSQLVVPEHIRSTAGSSDRDGKNHEGPDARPASVSWIIEVSSQVIFSSSVSVHYEILLGRDEKSLSLGMGSAIMGGVTPPTPGQISDYQQSQGAKDGHHSAEPKGLYSRAVRMRIDDTASLWNTPKLPEWDETSKQRAAEPNQDAPVEQAMGSDDPPSSQSRKQKKVHLVVITHGLHSNLGSDMMFLKESIDAAAKQAKEDAKKRRTKKKKEGPHGVEETDDNTGPEETKAQHNAKDEQAKTSTGTSSSQGIGDEADEDEDDEEVIVRGFSGNAVRTERGIKYLGKRLAKYVLTMTYPDQPFKPVRKQSTVSTLSHALRSDSKSDASKAQDDGPPTHNHSTIHKEPYQNRELAYKITSISFIGHSLGGLVQTYAVAYIQKHSPQFFEIIKPINFIALATPFLGLSNENPLYVKFALDFGLVGRTGQDLGLTWRAPTLARSGWGAIVSSISENTQRKTEERTAPESKPLLRILPTGPAHAVLKKFRNRTVYSNVVNDGIVPLRTSCLLFLDWQGLGRVEKARRENGLVGTLAEWGWAEVTGQNSSSPSRNSTPRPAGVLRNDSNDSSDEAKKHGSAIAVPQPPPDVMKEDTGRMDNGKEQRGRSISDGKESEPPIPSTPQPGNSSNPFSGLIKIFQPNSSSSKSTNPYPKQSKIYTRSQTLRISSESSDKSSLSQDPLINEGSKVTAGDSDVDDPTRLSAPPKTTFFESARDVLKPPLPPMEFLLNPSARSKTIFHDRVYHPEDIPAPPLKRRAMGSVLLRRRTSSLNKVPTVNHTDSSLSARDYDDTRHTNPDKDPRDVVDGSAMKVEEKIARAYHRDLSWRKVLVRLEPDAHNNIIVRRMFANAYGWPVIQHLCETHFSDSAEANTPDSEEDNLDHANKAQGNNQDDVSPPPALTKEDRTLSESIEAEDKLSSLQPAESESSSKASIPNRPAYDRWESVAWSDRDWADSADESDEPDEDHTAPKPGDEGAQDKRSSWTWTEAIAGKRAEAPSSPKGTDQAEISAFLGTTH